MTKAEILSATLAEKIDFAHEFTAEERERLKELNARADQGDTDAGLAAFILYVKHLTNESKRHVIEALTAATEGKEEGSLAY